MRPSERLRILHIIDQLEKGEATRTRAAFDLRQVVVDSGIDDLAKEAHEAWRNRL